MTKLVLSALAVAFLLASTWVSTANSAERVRGAGAAPSFWRDYLDTYGGFGPNTQEGTRAFWDHQTKH
jgi:hypothetical protein